MPKKNDIVVIKWLDTYQDPRWQNEKEISRPQADCLSVGFYLKKDKEFIYLSSTISGNTRDNLAIPRGCISEIKTL